MVWYDDTICCGRLVPIDGWVSREIPWGLPDAEDLGGINSLRGAKTARKYSVIMDLVQDNATS
jgi:hypothetical protein